MLELAQQVAARMDGDGVLAQRFLRRQHGGQLLVLHAEQAHRRRGDIEALGHHRRHAVAGEADGLGEQRLVLWAVLVRQKTVTAVETLRGVLVREHGDDAGQGQRLGRIDVRDTPVRDRAEEQLGVEHARQPHVGRVHERSAHFERRIGDRMIAADDSQLVRHATSSGRSSCAAGAQGGHSPSAFHVS